MVYRSIEEPTLERNKLQMFNIFFKTPSQQKDNTSNSKPNSVALLGNSRKDSINKFMKNQEK